MSNILRNQICTNLTEARARTLELIAPLSEDDLLRQHDPLMSPILWDLGHIAHFEELWLVRNLEGPIEFSEMPGLYNPFENPRRVRGALALPTLEECRVLMREIRSRVLERMSHVRFDTDNELLRDGYVYSMVLQHEYQHNETILQTLQLKQGMPYRAPRAFSPPAPRAVDRNASARFAGGRVRVGTNDRAVAYDNERPQHEIDLVLRTLVVVRHGAIVRSNTNATAGEASRRVAINRARRRWRECARSPVRHPLLELKRLENRLVVLILVLKNHGVDVSIA